MGFSPFNNEKKSLTFIEVLIVVIIIGILIRISVVQLKGLYLNLLLKNTCRQLQSFMNYISQHSIVRGEVVYLNIDNDNKKYWAEAGDGKIALRARRIPDAINIESQKQQIVFYPDAKIDKITIKLINPDNESMILTTEGVYGGVKLKEQ